MLKGVIKKLMASVITTTMILQLLGTTDIAKARTEINMGGTYGVGEGVYWPEQVFAPFVDMTLTTSQPGYGAGGTPYLPKLSEDTGIKFFNLGFIQSAGGVENGMVKWGWASIKELSEGSSHEQYIGLKKSIKDLRAIGGDVIISFGGLNGIPFWKATQDVDVLANTYRELIDGYGLTRIDLDIEGDARDKQSNIANAKAIKKVQEETGVEVVLTVPVLPEGLTSFEIGLMDAYLSQGVDIKMVNIMAMCYGSGTLLPGENYGTGSMRAIDSTAKQIKECYRNYAGKDITIEEAYRKVGATTSVGFEGAGHPIFTPEWTNLVVNHAIQKGIGMTSFWSLNRDSQLQSNQGISGKYEHTKINMKFGSQSSNPNGNFMPRLYGVKEKLVGVNKNFDPMAGVLALDKEDGDISSNIKIEGAVNMSIPGIYRLIYTISDSKGKSAKIERKITVQSNVPDNKIPQISGVSDKIIFQGRKFDSMEGIKATDAEDGNITRQIKVAGNIDTNKVGKYKLTYTVTDSDGASTSATAIVIVSKIPPYNAEVYDPQITYKGKEYVLFKEGIYKCKWWIQGEDPDKLGAWEFIEKFDMGVENQEVLDLAVAAKLYNFVSADIGFNEEYDINKDGIIDIYDLVSICRDI